MRELVIVIADLYLEREPEGPPAFDASAGAAPALEHLLRFGSLTPLAGGWRAWVARWAGLAQYAAEAPASIAAAPLAARVAGRAVWLASPLHLTAGLTRVHFDRRSMLRLPRTEADALAASFREVFHGSGFDLHPLESGELLLCGPADWAPSRTTEPARLLLTEVTEALAVGEGAPALRRLSAEIEMWLHGHAVNAQREQRGAPAISALWLWGGGAPAIAPGAASRELMEAAFGADAYVSGLWRLAGGEIRPMPVDFRTVIGEPRAQRALGVVEIGELMQAEPSWRLADAVTEIDRRLISPALEALRHGELERLALGANDRCLSLRAIDRWRLWRRKRTALAGLM
ncbi:MAG TPA: hypothetical protein VJ738_00255 [Steroidobacteraceae bacterium]|nr:hypothetical protein [Steroidobacteraceae bacterium]